MQASAVRKMSLASQVPPTPLPHSNAVSGSYSRPPALGGRTNKQSTIAGLHYCCPGYAFFALAIHGADESKVGSDGEADKSGKQPAARPAEPALRFDGIGP